jgi:hypothetical protein
VLDDPLSLYNVLDELQAEDSAAGSSMDGVNAIGYDSQGDGDINTTVDVEMEVATMFTQFDPSLWDNQRFPAERDGKLNVTWTKKERELAERGVTVSDTLELQTKVSASSHHLWR